MALSQDGLFLVLADQAQDLGAARPDELQVQIGVWDTAIDEG